MRNTRVEVCWAPECDVAIEQVGRGRTQRYCSTACRQRAVRRGGGKAPSEPYPPRGRGAVTLPAKVRKVSVKAPPENSAPPVSRPVSPSPVEVVGPTAGGAELGAGAHAETTPAPSAVPVFTERPPLPPAALAEPTISLADHLAKMAEVANPPEPEPPAEHPLVAKYRTDLEALGMEGSRDGLQVLQLAGKLVSSATSPAASAGLSRELKGLMEGLEQNSPEAMAERDPSLFIRERTLAKLKALAS